MPRRLGQHFLRSASVERLLRVIAPQADDVFLEIGPGAGARSPSGRLRPGVVAVELDAALAARLREHAPANVRIVTGDALRVDLEALAPAGARARRQPAVLRLQPAPAPLPRPPPRLRDVHVMLQDEVARRVASPPGSRE